MDTSPSPAAGNDAGRLPGPLSGQLSGQPAEPLTGDQLRELYSLMVAVRHLDTSAIGWQRQGLIPGYAPELGQEAAQVGSGYAVDTTRDFVFPTYREMGVARAMGVDMVAYMSTHKATRHGGLYNPWNPGLHPSRPWLAVPCSTPWAGPTARPWIRRTAWQWRISATAHPPRATSMKP